MKNPRGILHFGSRLNISSRQKMAHGSRVRKTRKQMSRFVSPRMKKIDQEIKMGMNITRRIGSANQASVLQRDELNVLKVGNSVQPKTSTTSEHLAPLATSAGKSSHSPCMPQHMKKDLTSKINSHSRYCGIVKDKNATLSPVYNSNGKLRPIELSRKGKLKQGLVHNSNCIKRSYSLENHLKAMPRLVHNTKNRPNLDQGATKGMLSKSGPDGCIGGMKDKNKRCEPLPGPNIHGDIDLIMPEKRRKYIERNDDVDDIDHQSGDDDSTKLLSYHANLKDCSAKVSKLFGSKCVVQQHDCCSKPIDESAWSGILKIDSKECISLAGHLSTKAGEKVWNLSKSLRRVVEVTKVCLSEVWPKKWEASRPTSDNIGLYFFPYKMRPDKSHDQLVKEVTENDLALRVTIDEAEMLIFSSILLPEQYQTFQSKHYLWGVFRPRLVEGKHGDESRHLYATAEAATNATTIIPIDTTVAATNVGALPTEAFKLPTKAHTEPTNRGWMDLSMGALPGRVVSFVVRQTPRVEQLIREMEREGAVIVAMQGEILTGDGSLSRQHGGHNGASRSSACAVELMPMRF